MKIEVAEDRSIVLKEVYSGILMETSEGNQIGICMRDNTFEINVLPKGGKSAWHRINMEMNTIDKEVIKSKEDDSETNCCSSNSPQ